METNCFRWAFTRLGVILCASDPRRDYQEPATPAVVRRGNNIDEFEKWVRILISVSSLVTRDTSASTLQSEHQKRKRTMETGQPRFTDPDHVRETLCTGPCWTSGYTNDTMQIVLTATRHDVAMISEGRFTQPPDYVVVARIVMTTKGALELAEAIKSTVAKHQAMTGRLHSSSGHA